MPVAQESVPSQKMLVYGKAHVIRLDGYSNIISRANSIILKQKSKVYKRWLTEPLLGGLIGSAWLSISLLKYS